MCCRKNKQRVPSGAKLYTQELSSSSHGGGGEGSGEKDQVPVMMFIEIEGAKTALSVGYI